MAKRRRRQTDPDVIPTEPDRRRATGKEDEDAFDEPEEEVVAPVINKWTTAANSRYLRLRARQTSKPAESSFPFLLLPAEIRNMIYRYLVISKSPEPIRLDSVRNFRSGGIETAILLANRLVCLNQIAPSLISPLA